MLLAALALALGLRLAAAFQLEHSWYGTLLMPDELTYDTWALKLREGAPHEIYSLSPLPAYVLWAVYRFISTAVFAGRVLNVVLGVGLCALAYGIGRELAGKSVGLWAALAIAIYRPFVFFSGTILKEPLGLVLFAATILLFLREYRRPRPAQALLLGVLAGLLVNVRQNAGVVALLFAVVLLWRARRQTRFAVARTGALLVLGAGLVCAPFTLMNLRGTGRASPLPLGGFDLYLGNHLDAHRPYWSPVPFTTTGPDTQGIEFMLEAERRTGQPMTLAQASDYWAGEVVRTARAQPGAFLRRLGEKALAAVSFHEEADNHDLEFARSFVGILRLPLLTYGVVMPLGAAGLLLAARRSRRAAALLAAVLVYGATMVAVFPNMRIRAPLLVILIPFAAVGIRHAMVRSTRTRIAFAALLALLGVLEALPVPNTPDLSAQRNRYAASFLQSGNQAEAARQLELAASQGGLYSDVARISLASYFTTVKRDFAAAQAWLDAVPDESTCAAAKYASLGILLRKQGRLPEAAAALERSITINGGNPYPRQALIATYEKIAPERVPAAQAELARVLRAWGPLAPPPFSDQ